jgi:hypothetical protein
VACADLYRSRGYRNTRSIWLRNAITVDSFAAKLLGCGKVPVEVAVQVTGLEVGTELVTFQIKWT